MEPDYNNLCFEPKLTFEQLAEWAGVELQDYQSVKNHGKYFSLSTSYNVEWEFYDDGDIYVDDTHITSRRTPEQMKQIIIAGGLLDE